MRRTIAILTAAGLLVPLAAHALNEPVWLAIHGGGGTYVMSDLNTEIDAYNASGTGWTFPHVEKGRQMGLMAGFETKGHWNIGLGWDRLDAGTKASDASGALEYKFSANNWRLFGEYSLRPVGRSTVFLGAAIGFMQENGKVIESSPTSGPIEYKLSGTDPSYEAYAGGNLWFSPRFGLTANAGYRYARVKEVQIDGYPFIMSNGEAMSLDFSGPTARVGIKVAGTTQ